MRQDEAYRPEQGCHDSDRCVRVLLRELLGHPEYLFGIVFPDLIVGNDRYTDHLEDCLLIPGLANAVPVDRPGL